MLEKKQKIIFDTIALRVLDTQQQGLRVVLEDFSSTHFLAGGTAIALQLGHRKSIDFDFFSRGTQGSFAQFVRRIGVYGFDVSDADTLHFRGMEFEDQDELHTTINGVRWSCINFYRTLYDDQEIHIQGNNYILGGLRIASLEELLSMKLFAMISRNKWKDAVDVYFLLSQLGISLLEALDMSENKYFINIFNREAVLEQMLSGYWDTVEDVQYIIDTPPSDGTIIKYLQKEAMSVSRML